MNAARQNRFCEAVLPRNSSLSGPTCEFLSNHIFHKINRKNKLEIFNKIHENVMVTVVDFYKVISEPRIKVNDKVIVERKLDLF